MALRVKIGYKSRVAFTAQYSTFKTSSLQRSKDSIASTLKDFNNQDFIASTLQGWPQKRNMMTFYGIKLAMLSTDKESLKMRRGISVTKLQGKVPS